MILSDKDRRTVEDAINQIGAIYTGKSDSAKIDLIVFLEIAISQPMSYEFAFQLNAINDNALKAEIADALSRLEGALSDDADVYETYTKIALPSMTGVGGSLLGGGAVYGAIKATSIAGVVTVGAPLVIGGILTFSVGGYVINRWLSIKRAKLRSQREVRALRTRIE